MSGTHSQIVHTVQEALTNIEIRLAEDPGDFTRGELIDRQIHLLDRLRGMEIREAVEGDRMREYLERRKQDQSRHDGIVRTLDEQERAAKFQQVTNQAIIESVAVQKAAAEAERTYFVAKLAAVRETI